MQAEFVSEKLHVLSNKIVGSQLGLVSVNSVSFTAINHIIYLIKNCFHEVGMTIALPQAVIEGLHILV
jgi:hypothetical protein